MDKANESAAQQLHKIFGLTGSQLDRVLAHALRLNPKQAFCDIYLEAGVLEFLTLDERILKNPSRSVSKGAGVRVVIGDKVGYSPTDHVTFTNLRKAAGIAADICQHAGDLSSVPVNTDSKNKGAVQAHDLYSLQNSPLGMPLSEKIALLQSIDAAARAYDPRIKNVTVSLAVDERVIIIATSLGNLVYDKRPMLRLNVQCLAQEGQRRETAKRGGGGRVEFSHFLNGELWQRYATEAAKEAVDLLNAEAAPAGEMTVVLGNGWPGVLIHEAVGHGLEGDYNRKGSSAFSGLVGQKVASPLCTVIDDGTMANKRGSLNIDDEGTPTGRTVLIENGVLQGYLQDQMNARLMGVAATGNGRRESYEHAPMPRMANTYLAGGQSTPEEIIASVKYGLFALSFPGGQVDITSGDFTFSTSGAYLIENGKLTRMVKGATLIGNGPKALHNVSMVGNDVSLDEGIGTCGKNNQDVPVCVGMPTVRIDRVTVGGTRS
ncbi:MAG: metalloprotease TldD [Candidatus Obscuribacterales bacterium]|nr:metalloprotease TldD [Candidatus Obscuribacterales bacterium]